VKQKSDQRPIVCGTDFSAAATEAVDIAAALVRRLETNLVLVHANQLVAALAASPLALETVISHARVEMDDEVKRLRDGGTEVKAEFVSDPPFNALVKAAGKSKARLIVVGAVGHGLARRVFVGSVAERTAETSPIPTLVVRPGGRLRSWIQGEHPLKILIGYDFSAASNTALRWVNQLTDIGKFQATILHSNWPPDEARRLEYKGPLPLAANPQEIQENLERDLKKRVTTFLRTKEITVIVEPGWGSPEGYLFEMSSRKHIDLIVVGTHQRRGLDRALLGSVSRAVLHHSRVSVAVIPPVESATPTPKK
jgi:nucleotide-binding universal stress UspA family protein